MKEIANLLSQFKSYSQCVDAYIEQSQAVIYLNKIFCEYIFMNFVNFRVVFYKKMYLDIYYLYVNIIIK